MNMWDGVKQIFTLIADATLGPIIGTAYILWLTFDEEKFFITYNSSTQSCGGLYIHLW